MAVAAAVAAALTVVAHWADVRLLEDVSPCGDESRAIQGLKKSRTSASSPSTGDGALKPEPER